MGKPKLLKHSEDYHHSMEMVVEAWATDANGQQSSVNLALMEVCGW